MTDAGQALLDALETHSVETVRKLLDGGLDARGLIRDKSPVQWLLEMYTRSERFSGCLRLLLDAGGTLDDPLIAPVLRDDPIAIQANPALIGHRTELVSAFTPLVGVSPLHIAAEYGLTSAAEALIELGADVDARAAVDAHGLGGHTPLFHCVNSARNHALPILNLLLEAGAAPDLRLAGLVWGKGFDWETALFDLTPISYAQCGLLPQMHRRERDVGQVVRLLLKASGRPVPPLNNIPNRYLHGNGA